MEKNQLLINYYKKEELLKAQKRYNEDNLTLQEIFKLANKNYITEEEIKEALGIDDEEIDSLDDKNNLEENVVDEQDIIIEDEEEKLNSEEVVLIDESLLEDYPNQPFKLYDEDKKDEMIESIKNFGIMQPLIVRKMQNNKYQILAGHNRKNCGKEAGMSKFPCIVKENLSDDEAKIYLVDTNLCTRDNISPMERARGYKIKYDTYKKKNIKTDIMEEIRKDNIGTARATLIKNQKTSNGTVQRYLRLTYLIPELQEAIEKDIIKINTGEKLSFLTNSEQKIIAELLEEKIKISDSIAKRIKDRSEKNRKEDVLNFLNKEEIRKIINQKEEFNKEKVNVTFFKNEIEQYLDNNYTEKEIKHYIFTNLKHTNISMY